MSGDTDDKEGRSAPVHQNTNCRTGEAGRRVKRPRTVRRGKRQAREAKGEAVWGAGTAGRQANPRAVTAEK